MIRLRNCARLINVNLAVAVITGILSIQTIHFASASEVVGDPVDRATETSISAPAPKDQVYEMRPYGESEACFSHSGVLQSSKEKCLNGKNGDAAATAAKTFTQCLKKSMSEDMYGNCQTSGRKSLEAQIRKCAGNADFDANQKAFNGQVVKFCSQSAGVGNCSDQGGSYLCSTNGSNYSSRGDCEDSCP